MRGDIFFKVTGTKKKKKRRWGQGDFGRKKKIYAGY